MPNVRNGWKADISEARSNHSLWPIAVSALFAIDIALQPLADFKLLVLEKLGGSIIGKSAEYCR